MLQFANWAAAPLFDDNADAVDWTITYKWFIASVAIAILVSASTIGLG
jgi:hypothetical protein